MPKSARLDPSVVLDSLIPVVDDLRSEFYGSFGVRPYHIDIVRRTWSGAEDGEGELVEEVERLDPIPTVEVWDGYKYELRECGLDDLGFLRVRHVSLQYTHGDLTGQPGAANTEHYLRVSGAHGQWVDAEGRAQFRDFTHDRPPYIDRAKDVGWVLYLRAVNLPRQVNPSRRMW